MILTVLAGGFQGDALRAVTAFEEMTTTRRQSKLAEPSKCTSTCSASQNILSSLPFQIGPPLALSAPNHSLSSWSRFELLLQIVLLYQTRTEVWCRLTFGMQYAQLYSKNVSPSVLSEFIAKSQSLLQASDRHPTVLRVLPSSTGGHQVVFARKFLEGFFIFGWKKFWMTFSDSDNLSVKL